MVAGRLVFNGVKLTDRDWDRTRDLASISTVSEPMELKLMTTSLSHLKATQHLNWGTYLSFSLGPALQGSADCLILKLSLKDSWKTGLRMFPILVLLPAIIYIA